MRSKQYLKQATMSGSCDALDEAGQLRLTPAEIVEALKAGNERFVRGENIERDMSSQVVATAAGQYPGAVILSCIDSRVPAEIVFDQGVGDLFSVRVAGNVINADVLGSIEFATKLAGSKVVVVMGHTSCGAVKGACDNVQVGHIASLVNNIRPSVDAIVEEGEDCSSANVSLVDRVAAHNVDRTIVNIREQSEIIRELDESGDIILIGAMYDVKSGVVRFVE